eukprot:721391-Pyramimonas_sp.AAC.1
MRRANMYTPFPKFQVYGLRRQAKGQGQNVDTSTLGLGRGARQMRLAVAAAIKLHRLPATGVDTFCPAPSG